MKNPFLLLIACIVALPAIAQINFEEITPPEDFSLRALRQSPTGELFVQAINQRDVVYSSTGGQNWSDATLPDSYTLEDMHFLEQGSPVFITASGVHLIRRNGNWLTMSLPGAVGPVKATFIREDTLFAYQDQRFAYSTDAGESFEVLFDTGNALEGGNMDIWKYGQDFILTYDTGVGDSLYAFGPEGALLVQEALEVDRPERVYNSCGELLILSGNTYYLYHADDRSLETGNAEDFFPGFIPRPGRTMDSRSGRFYRKQGNTVYRTAPCGSIWELLLSGPAIDAERSLWLDDQENVFLYKIYANAYTYYDTEAEILSTRDLPIDYAFVTEVNESATGQQAVATRNGLFLKGVSDELWVEQSEQGVRSIQYSPEGRLYLQLLNGSLFRSSDGGNTLEPIITPQVSSSATLEVPREDVLVLLDKLLLRVYYSLDGGQSWSGLGLAEDSQDSKPVITMVGEDILIMSGGINLALHRINTVNNVLETEPLDGMISLSLDGRQKAIMADGTIYFWAAMTGNPNGLYRYRWGEGLEFIASEDELGDNYSLLSVGDYLFGVSGTRVFGFEAGAFTELVVTGVPNGYTGEYILSDGGHLYYFGNHRIFRSVEPLGDLMSSNTQNPAALPTVAIYPNPANETLFLNMPRQLNVKAVIIDQSGRRVQPEQELTGNLLDISALAAGSYLLLLRKESRLIGRAAFVKQ